MRMGAYVTVVGIILSIGCAYVARLFPNAMDIVQLVFGFVNAPLFATFLLGMFWKRATRHGAFFGLVLGTLTSAIFHGLTIAGTNAPGVHGAWIAKAVVVPSEMAQNFWLAISAFSSCFFLTVAISLATSRTKSDEELKGLVYSLTEKVREPDQAWYATPAFLGTVLLVFCAFLNIYFW
jgi:SSS family solute:Na+ symporter